MTEEEELSDKCWNQRRGVIFLTNNPEQESEEEGEKEDSAMAALMRSADEEIEINCKLVRDVIEIQRERAKRETVLKLKSCLKSGKEGEPIETNPSRNMMKDF